MFESFLSFPWVQEVDDLNRKWEDKLNNAELSMKETGVDELEKEKIAREQLQILAIEKQTTLREQIKSLTADLTERAAESKIMKEEVDRLSHQLKAEKENVEIMLNKNTDQQVIALHEVIADLQKDVGCAHTERDLILSELEVTLVLEPLTELER